MLFPLLVLELIIISLLISFFLRRVGRTKAQSEQFLSWQVVIAKPSDSGGYPNQPDQLAGYVETLTALGFSLWGQYREVPPQYAPTDEAEAQSFPITWVYVDSAGTSYAEIIAFGQAGKMGLFRSFFDRQTEATQETAPDESALAYVETSHPRGESIIEPDFRSSTVNTSLGNAYDQHQRDVAAVQESYGTPLRFQNFQEFLAWDKPYRQHFLARKIKALVKRQSLIEGTVTVGLILLSLVPLIVFM